jgi:hypothetical protein
VELFPNSIDCQDVLVLERATLLRGRRPKYVVNRLREGQVEATIARKFDSGVYAARRLLADSDRRGRGKYEQTLS